MFTVNLRMTSAVTMTQVSKKDLRSQRQLPPLLLLLLQAVGRS
jgi:hypothetical protein